MKENGTWYIKRHVRRDCDNIQNTRKTIGQEITRLRWIEIPDQNNIGKKIKLWKGVKQEM